MEIFQFGDSPNLDLQEAFVEADIKFVCLLYDHKSKDADIHGTRPFRHIVDLISCRKWLGYY